MVNLSIGMTKEQVLQLAKNLGDAAKAKVVNFFENDEDGQISHVNELAILNSIFDRSGVVKMPRLDTASGLIGCKSECEVKNPDGSVSWSMLYDEDCDGIADGHSMSRYTELNKTDDRHFETKGYTGKDKDLDGVIDNKEPFHVKLEGDVVYDLVNNKRWTL